MSKVMDLNMLAMTGGKERTEKEYAALFEKTGFKLTRVIPTPSPMQIVEAVRV
jgi:carbamate kinase